jgi:hypothetical protein
MDLNLLSCPLGTSIATEIGSKAFAWYGRKGKIIGGDKNVPKSIIGLTDIAPLVEQDEANCRSYWYVEAKHTGDIR